jgi:hypothetical protein
VDPEHLIYGAIERGRLAILRALAQVNVSFRPQRFLCHAVKKEQKAVIEWLVKDQKVPRYADAIATAAAKNSVDFLSWMYRDAGFKNMSNQAMANAARYGQRPSVLALGRLPLLTRRGSDEHLRWLYERGCPSDHMSMFRLAAMACSVPTLTWLVEKAVVKPERALPSDAMANTLVVIQWLLGDPCGCFLHPEIRYLGKAIEAHNWPVIEWFVATHGHGSGSPGMSLSLSLSRSLYLPWTTGWRGAAHLSVPEMERLWGLGLRPPTAGFEYHGGADAGIDNSCVPPLDRPSA